MVITGASSGIGRALAFEFAARAFNLVLTGRNSEALRDVASECERAYCVRTQIYAADLTLAPQADAMAEMLSSQDLDYEVLVNNAGFGVKGQFATTGIVAELGMVRVQLEAMMKLTKALLPGMLRRGSGRILNVASVYAFAPVPQQSVYAACKAFLASFSTALREEIRGTGVTVTVLCPGATRTEFRTRAGIAERDSNKGMDASEVARFAVDGVLRGKALITPGVWNRGFVAVCRHLPVQWVPPLVNFINKRRGVNR